MRTIDLSGIWQCRMPDGTYSAALPGTLDTNGIGQHDFVAAPWHPDEHVNDALAGADVIATRLTRRHTYEGAAVFERRMAFAPPAGKRVFLECGRSRHLTLHVNGRKAAHFLPPSVSAPHVFEVTGLLTGDDVLSLTCDNSYPGWPHDDIVFSSAATDETQTNWNGALGYLRLRIEEPVFIHALRMYPHGDTLDVCAEISADSAWAQTLYIKSDALANPVTVHASGAAGLGSVWLRGLALADGVCRWDEGEGNLCTLTAWLGGQEKTATFGVRDFGKKHGRFTLNGRIIFLRCEVNCAVFPESGHPPMDVAAWKEILSVYKRYGVNCMRFHSHCPPEAAFAAADEMGMLMQPELSHWNPRNAFSSPESQAYYRAELEGMLRMLCNHPSFVMLSFGNELHMGDDGQAYADSLLALAREIDDTRLYASGSNNHYGKKGENRADDFYTADSYMGHALRATSSTMTGWLNERYPDLRTDYAPAIKAIRERCDQPVVSFEVGQYEILPDFDELNDFKGVTKPDNLSLIRKKVGACGLLPVWKQYVHAAGELSHLCYRAEIEAALRTEGLSGISLLGLQDFPGQGTALVGMLNSHLAPKPYPFAQPERFARFFTGVLPVILLPRFTFEAEETLEARVRMVNYGKQPLKGTPEWSLRGAGISLQGRLDPVTADCGGLTDLGTLRIALDGISRAARLTLTIALCGHENEYDVWVYPKETASRPECIHECRALDARALHVLRTGGMVLLAPDSDEEALPHSIKGQFSTDFWSVGTFPAQAGGMGQLIDASHPLFEHFPTDTHTDWQWWPFASQRAVILPEQMRALRPMVTLMDSYAYLRPMAQLLECRCGGGRLLLCTMGLHHLLARPEARALRSAIYRYMDSPRFAPAYEVSPDVIRHLVREKTVQTGNDA
ncbi:MAG: hypothetical protein IKJ11_07390 [Clostridia bacterium]|nr:hypothetical protein [Clostridia bacterium]